MKRQKTNDELCIELRTREFWFLLQQFGPSVILGLENPYLGWLVDEIRKDQRNALKSLINRGLVRKVSRNEIALDDVLARFVATCAHPENSLIVQFQNSKGENLQRYIHFHSGLIVEQVEFKKGQHHLTALKDREILVTHLNDALRLSTMIKGRGGKFRLPEDTMFEARSLCEKGHTRKALNNLKKAGLSEGKSTVLAAALSKPVANSAFALLSNRDNPNTQHVRGFALLESENGFWVLLPYEKNGQKMVEFIPSDPKSVINRFLDILP